MQFQKSTLKNIFHPLTTEEASNHYRCPPSLLRHLPWMEFDEANRCVVLQDTSVGAAFELSLVPSEAKPEADLIKLRDGLQGLFQDVCPGYTDAESPWIMQFYVQDELSMAYLYDAVKNYVQPTAQDSPFKKNYMGLMQSHARWLSRPEGLFNDDKVTDGRFYGGQRKVRLVMYRHRSKKMALRRGFTIIQDLNQVATRLVAKLNSVGITVKRLDGPALRDWLIAWFNPRPVVANGDTAALLNRVPYAERAEDRPFGYDFAEHLFYSAPKSDERTGVWLFDGLPHRYISVQHLSHVPAIGHLTRERGFGNFSYSLLDKFPAGSTFVLTVVMQSQEAVKEHLERIENNARKGPSTAAALAFDDCHIAKAALESGNGLLPTCMGIYLHGENLDDLAAKETELSALLLNQGLHVLQGEHELVPLHSYLHHLPFCYNYAFDKKNLYRSRYVFSKQLANLVPLYGRARGSGRPLIQFLNRGGESITLDPFNPNDKDNNSHLLMLGATGAGKSATSTDLLIKLMGTYRPYLVMVDAGNSFHLLKDYFIEQGLSVHHVAVTLNNPPILNPFADSEKMLTQLDAFEDAKKISEQALNNMDTQRGCDNSEAAKQKNTPFQTNENHHTDTTRDYLGEMALSAQLMLTGGEQKEQDKLTRQDRLLVLEGLIQAARTAKQQGHNQMIATDVVNALRQMAAALAHKNQEAAKQQRLRAMADSLAFFTKDTLASHVFNRRGSPWPDADITLFEQGVFKDTGYEAHNALAFMGLMQRTMAKAEARQHEARFTVLFGDEIHTLTKNPLTVVYLTQCAKMSRKFGLWLWLATQNVADFPQEAKKMLSMMEFWLCLGLSEAEMQAIEAFRPLTEEERQLFRSVRKAAKKYVEGVLLCPKLKALFRNVPPRLSLALAMTEKHEKAERYKLMQQYDISELEAAKKIAAKMQAG